MEKGTQVLITVSESRDFYVLIDPDAFLALRNKTVECLFSMPPSDCPDNFPFTPNPNYRGGVSPFQRNLIRPYRVEYYLEIIRRHFFPQYPRRSEAITLFQNLQDAHVYFIRHENHLASRILRRVKTSGQYSYSLHDSSWVDFLYLEDWKDNSEVEAACKAYWNGQKLKNHKLHFNGRLWSREPIIEVLYFGCVDFYDESTAPELADQDKLPVKLKQTIENSLPNFR